MSRPVRSSLAFGSLRAGFAGLLRRLDPWGLAAAGLGFALRAGLLLRYPDIEGRGDETVHYILGVLTSHLGADAIAYWAPLFEFFQAAAYRLLGPDPWNAKIFQVLVSTATIPLVYALAASIGGRRAARIAAFGMALYPTHVLFSHYLYNETLYLFLLTACVHLFHRRPGGPSRAEVVGSGVLFGLAALTRSVAVNFLPVWAAWSFLRGRRREALQVIGLALTAFLVISPWTLRNYLRYDRFLLVDPIVGFVAYYAFNQMPLTRDVGYRQRFVSERERCKGPVLVGQEPLPTVDELRAWFPPSAEHFLSTPERLRHQILTTRIELSVNLADVQRCEIERGLAYARGHPWHILHETLQRFYAFWGPNSKALRHVYERTYPDGPLRKESFPVLEWIVVLPTLVVFTLAILHYGLPRIHPAAEWIALFTAYYTATHMVAGAWSRYRLPLTGFAIALGAVWLAAPRLPAGRRRAVVVGALLLLYLGVSIHYLIFTLPWG